MKAVPDQQNRIATVRPNSNRVIITICVEAPTKRFTHQTTDRAPTNKIRPKPISRKPHTTRSNGYDRRAQLLAYVHGLRNAGHEKPQQPRSNFRPQSKMWKWFSATERTPASFLGTFERKERPWNYERIVSDEHGKISGSRSTKRINSRKKKHPGNSVSNFCRKLKCLLKQLSCGLQCNKA